MHFFSLVSDIFKGYRNGKLGCYLKKVFTSQIVELASLEPRIKKALMVIVCCIFFIGTMILLNLCNIGVRLVSNSLAFVFICFYRQYVFIIYN